MALRHEGAYCSCSKERADETRSSFFLPAVSAGHDVKGTAFTRQSGDLVKVRPSVHSSSRANLTFSTKAQLDLTDETAVTALLEEYKPDVVIHCAAERRPDVVEQ
ncbi:hypothetical protein JCM1840_005566, partial [Sporobolomyces johnsonii]